MLKKIKKIVRKVAYSNPVTEKIHFMLATLYWDGVHSFSLKVKRRFYVGKVKHLPLPEELESQINHVFATPVLFSIVVPLYNTPERFLEEMIDSVVGQTYGNWELCLADASDTKKEMIEDICRKRAESDPRIRYIRLPKNEGISGNTNAALTHVKGEYIGLLDHDDLLHPCALYEMMMMIEKTGAEMIFSDEGTFAKTHKKLISCHFKPDFAIDNLRANNYICHFTVFKKTLLEKAGGGFRVKYDGAQDHDLFLRMVEKTDRIAHVPRILYYWRAHQGSTASSIGAKLYAVEAGKKAVEDHLARLKIPAKVHPVPGCGTVFRVQYYLKAKPLISILIPNKDHKEDLRACVKSILEKTAYSNYEVIIIENNSVEKATFSCYEELEKDPRIFVETWKGTFNYPEINNFGASLAKGEYLLFLNNDTEIISPDWLEEMLMFAQREDVGAVGAKLFYPDDTIQHAGIGIGILKIAGHYHRHYKRAATGYMTRLRYANDVSAVTAACLMVKESVFTKAGGFDPAFAVAFNDIDFCLRLREKGYLNVITPYAELYHYESKSRGLDSNKENLERFAKEIDLFMKRWEEELSCGDPYYNPNLTLEKEDFSFR